MLLSIIRYLNLPFLFQVSLDKLYMSAANHVFEKKMKPLILEQRKRGQDQGNSEVFKVAKTMMKYIQCIQRPEWAAATAHKITQEIPPGLSCTLETTRLCVAHACFIHPIVVCSWKALRRWQHWSYVCHLERHGLKIQTKRSRFCFYQLQILLLPLLKCKRKLLYLTALKQEAARARGETFLSKVKLQFQHSATENTLITSQLNSPEHLKLTSMPARLILALYEHSSVELRYRDTGAQTYPGEQIFSRQSKLFHCKIEFVFRITLMWL